MILVLIRQKVGMWLVLNSVSYKTALAGSNFGANLVELLGQVKDKIRDYS